MSKSEFAFEYPIRVRWSETDVQGIVFNARYLDFADVAITEYWRESGIMEAISSQPFEAHAKTATVTWTAPIKPDEMIVVMARTVKTGRSSITQLVEIHGQSDDGSDDLRATVDLVYVHVDVDTRRPTPLPEWMSEKFAAFDAAAGHQN